MPKKLLFYIDNWFFHFGLAKQLQSHIDGEFYAVIDADKKSKKFFEKQKLVQFKKTWFLDDPSFPIKMKPDLNYLKEFEKKYKINLWKIAYSDRVFYRYNPHHKFSNDEILYLLEQKCRKFEEMFTHVIPDIFLSFLTVSYHHILLYEMCRSVGSQILMLQPIKFGNRMTIAESSNKFDNMQVNANNFHYKVETFEDLQNYLKKFDTYSQTTELMKNSFESKAIERYKSNLLFFSSFWDNDYQKQYLNFGRTRSKILVEKISRKRNRQIRQSFLDKNSIRDLEKCKPYVLFTLHYEPERILLIDAPFYDDQLSIIRNIARSMPVGYTLCVKEHFMMKTLGWRDISFYKSIIDLPNVKLIHPSFSPEIVIKNSSLIITIAGTTAQEAAFYNKPSIVFTEQPYSILSSVYTLKNINELPQAIHNSLGKEVDLEEMKNYLQLIEENSFEINWRGLSNEFAFTFGFKGPAMAAELQEEKIKHFLEKYKVDFETLTKEHLKKILA